MNEHITDVIEASIALLLFIAALTNGLIIVSEQSEWLHTAINANKSKDRNVSERWAEMNQVIEQETATGADIIGMIATKHEHPFELVIDGVRFEMPVSYLPAYDLSFITPDQPYRVSIERDNQGFIKRMNYERE